MAHPGFRGDDCFYERRPEHFSAFSGLMHELEEREIERLHPSLPTCNNRNDQRRRVKIADIRHDFLVATSIHQTLCSAESPVDALIGRRRGGIVRERRLLLVGRGEDCHQFVEGREILPCRGRLYDGLDSMIAGDEARICASHRGLALCAIPRLLAEAETPPNSPLIVGGRILEEAAHGALLHGGFERQGGRRRGIIYAMRRK